MQGLPGRCCGVVTGLLMITALAGIAGAVKFSFDEWRAPVAPLSSTIARPLTVAGTLPSAVPDVSPSDEQCFQAWACQGCGCMHEDYASVLRVCSQCGRQRSCCAAPTQDGLSGPVSMELMVDQICGTVRCEASQPGCSSGGSSSSSSSSSTESDNDDPGNSDDDYDGDLDDGYDDLIQAQQVTPPIHCVLCMSIRTVELNDASAGV